MNSNQLAMISFSKALDIDEDELQPLEDPVKDLPLADYEEAMYELKIHNDLNEIQKWYETAEENPLECNT